MITAHGQKKRYYHEIIGCNSRLDAIHAAILNVKLKYLDQYLAARQRAADYYFENLGGIEWIDLPLRADQAVHSFNQFTIKVKNQQRDALQEHLKQNGIPSVIYYPLPLYRQPALGKYNPADFKLKNTEMLCSSVLSIPMHTELTEEIQGKIVSAIKKFRD